MRLLTLLGIAVTVTACGRLERVCTMPPVRGMCVNDAAAVGVDRPLTATDLRVVVATTLRYYEARYGVRVGPTELAQREDLYVVLTPDDETTAAWCDGGLTGCYTWPMEEIFVNGGMLEGQPRSAEGRALSLAHELIHFWNRHVLRDARPDVFQPWGFMEAEQQHLTRGAFMSIRARNDADAVEYDVLFELRDYFARATVGSDPE